jgi:alanyl-tRNA synthetase
MKSSEIRQRFLDFFARNGHAVVASSSLVPGNDPTLLFTNAGMVQFKDVFLGRDVRAYTRAVSSQRCVRAGGKHNDLENVGYTARHHTFFEMLGNFSFGDYFKADAIHLAWDFLTVELALPKEKLWITVYHTDDEAYRLWTEVVGVAAERVIRIGDKAGGGSDNFWQMGDTGPCGPCTEIFYDHGAGIFGGPPGSPDEDGDRYIEIWNLVFMQFNRDEAGILHPLPKPSVDTGMGLERISAVMQHVHSNYEIDLFVVLIHAASRVTACADLGNNSLKVIADHIRACAFLIVDGVIPGNEGRGYVLRRIIRRAIRHGYQLGQTQPFFHLLVADLAGVMGLAYPELVTAQEMVAQTLLQEELRFAETLEHGMAVLQQAMPPAGGLLDGETAFKLYDTYGFPLDLTADIGREHGFGVDTAGFEAAMAAQRARARSANKFTMQNNVDFAGTDTDFQGYDCLNVLATVQAIYVEGIAVAQIAAGEDALVVLNQTPFYAESGGQMGDRGVLSWHEGRFDVVDTQKIRTRVFGHQGRLQRGILRVGDVIEAHVDAENRRRTAANHSATHLLHAALRKVLGGHVSQKGSLVDGQRLRFDFAHAVPVQSEQIVHIENLVNAEIQHNHVVGTDLTDYDTAVRRGAMALFDEKYGDEVRVVSMGAFSVELCGGTHTTYTGDIGLFVITAESGVAAGVRRIEAVTGASAVAYLQQQRQQLHELAAQLKVPATDLMQKSEQLLRTVAEQNKEIDTLKSRLAVGEIGQLAAGAVLIAGVKVVSARLDNADVKLLREVLDQLKARLGACVVVLASTQEDKVSLIAGVSSAETQRYKAGELANFVAQQVGGKGGGRADMAQAGGTDVAALPAALASVPDWVFRFSAQTTIKS